VTKARYKVRAANDGRRRIDKLQNFLKGLQREEPLRVLARGRKACRWPLNRGAGTGGRLEGGEGVFVGGGGRRQGRDSWRVSV